MCKQLDHCNHLKQKIPNRLDTDSPFYYHSRCSILIQSTKCNCTRSVFIHRFNPKMSAGNARTSKLLLPNFTTEFNFYFLFFTCVWPFRAVVDYPKAQRLWVRSIFVHFFRSQYLTVCLSWPLIYVTVHFCFRKDTGNRICVENLYKNSVKYFRALVSVAKVIGVRYIQGFFAYKLLYSVR